MATDDDRLAARTDAAVDWILRQVWARESRGDAKRAFIAGAEWAEAQAEARIAELEAERHAWPSAARIALEDEIRAAAEAERARLVAALTAAAPLADDWYTVVAKAPTNVSTRIHCGTGTNSIAAKLVMVLAAG